MTQRKSYLLLLLCLLAVDTVNAKSTSAVTFTQGLLEVPTYTFGRSQDVAPLFEIGNSKGAYPYAALDRESLSSHPVPIKYEALTLENEYLKVIILPELGGRLWSAWDKVAKRNIFYYTSAIKPSSYNHRGGWPVGNLEVYGPFDTHMLTWPGEPWPWEVVKKDDGSVSVVLSHVEHFFRNKISMEITLCPGSAFLSVTVKLHNKNSLPNRYLLWTNAGVPATMGTRYLYPMTKTIGHDTADYGSWPVFEGVDLSWFRNNRAMLGVFGLDIYDDFIAGYDYDADYGTICYTNRQIARGIKTWTWGVSQTAKRHESRYTDSDGAYLEIQSGRFVWDGNYEFINPGKTDGWTEYWYGIGGLGGLTTATRDLAIHLEFEEGPQARLRISPTGTFPDATLSWRLDGNLQGQKQISLAVGQTTEEFLKLDGDRKEPLRLLIETAGRVLLDYTYRPDPKGEFALDSIPRDFGPNQELTIEELFQKGLTHEKLGQIDEAIAVYQETLERDPNYTQPNLQLGLLALTRFQAKEAIQHFERVLERDPSNGDAHYYLAVTYAEEGQLEKARKHFYRLLPSSGKFEQRDFGLGVLALREGNLPEALSSLSSAAERLPAQISVHQAYAFALRKGNQPEAALAELGNILRIDPTNMFAWAETVFSKGWSKNVVLKLAQMTASNPQGYLELATEYMALGAWEETAALLHHAIEATQESGSQTHPLLFYYRAFALERLGNTSQARSLLKEVSSQPVQIYLFPFRRETILVLKAALEIDPKDANAAALLGDLLYARSRKEEGVALWESAIASDPNHYQALRNLGWALLEKSEVDSALPSLERAADLRPDDLEIINGVTQLYTRLGRGDDAVRVVKSALEKRPGNDLLIELMASAQSINGQYDSALELLKGHQFGPRHQSYSVLRLYQAVELLKVYELTKNGEFAQALAHLRAAENTPTNLGVDNFVALKSSRLLFFEALIHRAAGDNRKMVTALHSTVDTVDQDYNGQGLFRAVALVKTGKADEAEEWFTEFEMINPQRQKDNTTRVKTEAFYLAGIYSVFRGDEVKGREYLQQALRADESNLFARQALLWLEAGLFEGIRVSTNH